MWAFNFCGGLNQLTCMQYFVQNETSIDKSKLRIQIKLFNATLKPGINIIQLNNTSVFAKGCFIVLNIFNNSVALNTSSSRIRSDFSVVSTSGGFNLKSINSTSTWYFCFKVLVHRFYYKTFITAVYAFTKQNTVFPAKHF